MRSKHSEKITIPYEKKQYIYNIYIYILVISKHGEGITQIFCMKKK